jgi:RHS repeat-associated protein
VTTRAYLDKYIRNLVGETDVYDALLNTNDADDVLIAKTIAGYDNYGAMSGMENYGGAANPPGHLSSYDATLTLRGNLTGVTTFSDVSQGTSVTRNQKIDLFGNTTKAQVSCCSEKTFYCDGHTNWARPCTVTSGNPADKCLTTIQAYDFNTLAVTSVTDSNNQTATYSYDAAQRVTGSTAPTGASSTAVYNAWGGKTSSSATYNEGGTNKTLTETAVYDGWGQMTQSVDDFGAQANYTYDAMGHLQTQTNPFPQGGTPGPVTSYQYDLQGRTTTVTLPGGNTMQTAYSGSIPTATDQVNRKIKREADGLGRLIKVTEQDATGALAQETSYTYDAADRLTLVNQGNQTRAFKYDSQGRLMFERIPEQTATINDGSGTLWTTKYTYTDWGAVSTKQEARGVIITYSYDTLHRLTSVSYNTGSAPGVAATPTVSYTYDSNGTCDTTAHSASGTTKGLLLAISVGSFYSESYAYDSNQRVQAVTRTIDGRSYTTSYQYDTANQVTQITYPSTRIINIGHDSKGRVTSVGSFLSSITYNGIGQMTADSLGNGVTEGFGYDANRMQLTSQTATRSGGPANGLLNLTYGYNASAGQMGAGTTAGNAGQLMSVSGLINSTTESASYTYDNVGRLLTSNQTSNGTSAQRRFDYDRWGNRTTVWDATSGGAQIQNLTLEMSNSVPTNRISSVGSGKTTVNYSYDAAGNVTNDGSHSYTYDAENRLVAMDSTAAQYGYDQQNQRVKKTTGGVTVQYVWQGSQVFAEYNGSSGALLTEYVYSGSRLLAKVESGATSYFLNDRLSVRLMLDGSGNVVGRQAHLPYGEDFASSGTQDKHHLTHYERDSESGTDYAMRRQYGNAVGRFMQVDPIAPIKDAPLALGSIGDPQNLNRYNYSRNDAINLKDPTGGRLCYGYNATLNIYVNGVLVASFYLGFFTTFCEGGKGPGGGKAGKGGSPQRLNDRQAKKFASDATKAFLDANPNCALQINDAAKNAGIIDENLQQALSDTTYVDLSDSSDLLSKKMGSPELGFDFLTPAEQELTLRMYIRAHPGDDAFTNWKRDRTYFVPGFLPGVQNSGAPLSALGGLVVHEALHVLFGPNGQNGSHASIANALLIPNPNSKDGNWTDADDGLAAVAIDAWLGGGCKK